MARTKDYQRQDVYRFEGKVFLEQNPEKLTKSAAVELMHRICLEWGVPPTHIQSLRKDATITLGKYIPRRRTHPVVKLKPRYYYKHVLIHELAHHVMHCRFSGVEAHGPEFLRMYAEMLSLYLIPGDWIAAMRSSGLCVAVTPSLAYAPAPSQMEMDMARNSFWYIAHNYQRAFWGHYKEKNCFADRVVLVFESHMKVVS